MTAAGLFEWPALLAVLPGRGGPARLGAITIGGPVVRLGRKPKDTGSAEARTVGSDDL